MDHHGNAEDGKGKERGKGNEQMDRDTLRRKNMARTEKLRRKNMARTGEDEKEKLKGGSWEGRRNEDGKGKA